VVVILTLLFTVIGYGCVVLSLGSVLTTLIFLNELLVGIVGDCCPVGICLD
jgi:hypothetical protein